MSAPTPPSEHVTLPADLERIILACLAKDKVDRPSDAIELSAQLAPFELDTPWSERDAKEWWDKNMPVVDDDRPEDPPDPVTVP